MGAVGSRNVASDGAIWDEVYADSHSVFFANGRDLAIELKKDSAGRVTRIDIISGGTTINARRIE